jgi:anti-sigma B factor antagonist
MNDRFECELGGVRAGEPRDVQIRGEIDLATAPELEAQVIQAFEGGPSSVVLDLTALTFIDSSGLRALVSLSNHARDRGASLALKNVPRHAQRVLDLTGLADFFGSAGS